MITPQVVLGAEQQAALSLALAYPERQFQFVTDQSAVDGWDIPNVSLRFGQPEECLDGLALCPRWLPQAQRESMALSTSFERLAASELGPYVLPVEPRPCGAGAWRMKGDLFHRPDAPLSGVASDFEHLTDSHGCGLVYQREVRIRGTFLVLGRAIDARNAMLGVLELLAERFFRIDVLQAAQTVDRPDLVELSLAALAVLGHAGCFTCTWLDTDEGPRLASVRPVVRAGLSALRAGGVDLFSEPGGLCVAASGRRFVAFPHYASYRKLGI